MSSKYAGRYRISNYTPMAQAAIRKQEANAARKDREKLLGKGLCTRCRICPIHPELKWRCRTCQDVVNALARKIYGAKFRA